MMIRLGEQSFQEIYSCIMHLSCSHDVPNFLNIFLTNSKCMYFLVTEYKIFRL